MACRAYRNESITESRSEMTFLLLQSKLERGPRCYSNLSDSTDRTKPYKKIHVRKMLNCAHTTWKFLSRMMSEA